MKIKNNRITFSKRIQIKIYPFPILLPSPKKYLIIQGNFWPIPKEITKHLSKNELEITKEMLNLLVHQYHFNAFSGSPVKKQLYKKYLLMLFKSFSPSYVRIKFKMSNRKKHKKISPEEIKSIIKKIPSPPAHTLLGIKLWDEPLPSNLSQVINDYTKVKNILKNFKMELSLGKPIISDKLWSLIDIFVVSPYSLSSCLQYIHTYPNKKILLYANRNHSDYEDARKMQFIGWAIYKYKLDGYHFWGINYLWNQNPDNCGENIINEKKCHFRRGTLLYYDIEKKRILPSLRLEMFIQGIYDYLLLKQLHNNVPYIEKTITNCLSDIVLTKGKISFTKKNFYSHNLRKLLFEALTHSQIT